jgi:UPF0716 protein FxsA
MGAFKSYRVLFKSLPIIELLVFILVATLVGVIPVLIIIVVSYLLGKHLFQQGGKEKMLQLHQAFLKGEPFTAQLLMETLPAFAAFLLMVPGLVTTLIGLLLLIPFLRKCLVKYLKKHHLVVQTPAKSDKPHQTYDAEYWHDDD